MLLQQAITRHSWKCSKTVFCSHIISVPYRSWQGWPSVSWRWWWNQETSPHSAWKIKTDIQRWFLNCKNILGVFIQYAAFLGPDRSINLQHWVDRLWPHNMIWRFLGWKRNRSDELQENSWGGHYRHYQAEETPSIFWKVNAKRTQSSIFSSVITPKVFAMSRTGLNVSQVIYQDGSIKPKLCLPAQLFTLHIWSINNPTVQLKVLKMEYLKWRFFKTAPSAQPKNKLHPLREGCDHS